MMRSTPPRTRSVVSFVLAVSVVGGLAVLASADDERTGGPYRPVHPHAYPIDLPEGTPARSGVPITTHLRILDDEDPVYRLYALNEIARFSRLGAYEDRVRARVEVLTAEELSSAVRLAALRAVRRWSAEDAIALSERIIRDGDASSGLRVGAWVVGMEHDAERFGPMLEAVTGEWSFHRQRALWWASLHLEPEALIAAAVAGMERASPSTNIAGGVQAPRPTNEPTPSRFSEFRQWEVLFNALGRGMDQLEHPMPTELSERLGSVMAERLKAHLTSLQFQRAYRVRHNNRHMADLRNAMQQFLSDEHGLGDTQSQLSNGLQSIVSSMMEIATGGSMAEILWVLDRDPVARAAATAAVEAWGFTLPAPTHVIRAGDEREEQRWRELREEREEIAELLWLGFKASLNRDRSGWRPTDPSVGRIGLADIVVPESLLSHDERRFYDALVAPPER